MHVSRVEQLAWESNENNRRVPESMRKGAKRAWAVRGQEGFYVHVGDMAPNFRVEAHSHRADELIVVLQGSVTFDGMPGALGPGDVVVIAADDVYGFTAGAQGLRILNVRRAEVPVDMAQGDSQAQRAPT